jgi:hypothetical protein
MMKNWLRKIGWPYYECECCVGQEWWQGCYCAYHDAYMPCWPHVPRHARVARWLYTKLFSKSPQ